MGNNDQLAQLKENLQSWKISQQEASPAYKGADLSGFDLPRVNLRRANLQKANLRNTNLAFSDLREADLEGAFLENSNLQGADLSHANLQGTNLRGADLECANLAGAIGLESGQVTGANLSGAILPAGFRKFQELALVGRLSQRSRWLFILVLAACALSWTAIASTTDALLLNGAAFLTLPGGIQTAIPIGQFYLTAPLILLVLYLSFHFYIQWSARVRMKLPAFFPDGSSPSSGGYPWLLKDIFRSGATMSKHKRSNLPSLQASISTLSAWWLVPVTLFWFWFRCLYRHDVSLTYLQLIFLIVSSGTAFFLTGFAAAKDRQKRAIKILEFVIGVSVLWTLSVSAVGGSSEGFLSHLWAADFSRTDVSTKPQYQWRKEDEQAQMALVKGAQLDGKNLRNIHAMGAFLAKADLQKADLRGADLADTDLQKASLREANLQGASLWQADLQGADLQGADLRGASLSGADLRGADGLNASQIKAASNWDQARYSEDLLKDLGLPPDHNKSLDLAARGSEPQATVPPDQQAIDGKQASLDPGQSPE